MAPKARPPSNERVELFLNYLVDLDPLGGVAPGDSMSVFLDGSVPSALALTSRTVEAVRGTWEAAPKVTQHQPSGPAKQGFKVPLFRLRTATFKEIVRAVSSAPGNRMVVGYRKGASPAYGCVCWTAELPPDSGVEPPEGFYCGPRYAVANRVRDTLVVLSVMDT